MKNTTKRSVNWLKRWLFNLFREWYQSFKEAENFTVVNCPNCQTPAASPRAIYCAQCGVHLQEWFGTSLIEMPGMKHFTDVERITENVDMTILKLPTGMLTREWHEAIKQRGLAPDTQKMNAVYLQNKKRKDTLKTAVNQQIDDVMKEEEKKI